jgi:hypothetical protein
VFATALAAGMRRRSGAIREDSTLVEVVPGGAADAAGMRDGDRIKSVGGEPVARFPDLRGVLAPHAGKVTDVVVERDGQAVHLSVTPGPAGSRSAGKIGVVHPPEPVTAGEAIRAALPLPFTMMAARLEEARRPKELVGPIGITRGAVVTPALGGTVFPSVVSAAVGAVDGLLLVALFLFPFRRRDDPAGSPAPSGIGHPWRRCAARIVDVGVFGVSIILALALIDPALVDAVGASLLLLTIPIEAALLASWGTTPGKALLGFSVRDAAGGKLPFAVALRRSAAVWLYGLAANLPVGLVTGLLAFGRVRRSGVAYWDALDGHRVAHREVSGPREAVAVALVGLFLLAVVAVALKAAADISLRP